MSGLLRIVPQTHNPIPQAGFNYFLTLVEPNAINFKLELVDPKLAEFNERASRAIHSLTAPDSRERFEQLVRSIETD
jgi:hypothetical protein